MKKLENFQLPNSSKYYYIFDRNADILYHGSQEELIGKNLLKYIKQEEILTLIKKSLVDNQATGLYDWLNPKTKKIEKKFTYIKKIPNTGLYLATGFYVNEIEKDIKKDIIKTIKENRFGTDGKGYFWIHSLSGIMIVHPMNPN